MEDALKRLDKLTQEEARMAAAENLKATHTVDERVKGVVDTVKGIDNKVTDVDDRVAGVDNRVAGVNEKVVTIDDRVKEIAGDIDEIRRLSSNLTSADCVVLLVLSGSQLRESAHKWLSPPDPSTNHNIACGTHHKKTATWFFQGGIYQEWKLTGSLLWLHGKRLSLSLSNLIPSDATLSFSWLGKKRNLVRIPSITQFWSEMIDASVNSVSSTVIQDIEAMCNSGNTSMAYFYFDFRDTSKQGFRDLVSSLLAQLSASSDSCCDILSGLHSVHDNGRKQPSDSSLTECLKKMVTLPDQPPTFLIVDALDECSNTSGISSPREMVLQLLKELVDFSLRNLRICVTSRPEFDIRNVLEPLTSRRVSLHDQSGQQQDIADYVRSVVYSDLQQIMKRWRKEDKELVIKTLSERADGM